MEYPYATIAASCKLLCNTYCLVATLFKKEILFVMF